MSQAGSRCKKPFLKAERVEKLCDEVAMAVTLVEARCDLRDS